MPPRTFGLLRAQLHVGNENGRRVGDCDAEPIRQVLAQSVQFLGQAQQGRYRGGLCQAVEPLAHNGEEVLHFRLGEQLFDLAAALRIGRGRAGPVDVEQALLGGHAGDDGVVGGGRDSQRQPPAFRGRGQQHDHRNAR